MATIDWRRRPAIPAMRELCQRSPRGALARSEDEGLACFIALGESVRVIGEPGRYYVSTAFTLACLVTSRRTVVDPTLDTTSYMLYMNDGVYGNFSSIIFDHQHPIPRILKCGSRYLYGIPDASSGYDTPSATEYSIWGPTCDGIDVISERTSFRHVLDVGDWLYFEEMGAYTKCSATRFNGFTDRHEVAYVCSDVGARALLGW